MARKVVTTIEITDDFDRSREADDTVEFTFEGVVYTVDTSIERAQAFRDFIAPYMEVASGKEKVKPPKAVPAPPSQKRGSGHLALPRELRHTIRDWALSAGYRDVPKLISYEIRSAYVDATGDTRPLDDEGLIKWREKRRRDEIRAWANENGYEVSNMSIIPHEVVEAFDTAHPKKMFEVHHPAISANSNGVTPDMRNWAREHGHETKGGYVPKHVRDLYHADQAAQDETADAAVLNGAHV